MASNFWNNPGVEPKRNFRFMVRVGNFPNLSWLVKTVDKPKFNVSSVEHRYINHTFNYPGRVTWQPVSMTLVDPVSPVDSSGLVMAFVKFAGYMPPAGDANSAIEGSATNMTKARAVGALGDVTISHLGVTPAGPISDAERPPTENIVDQWRLVNAFIDGPIDFGSLSYDDESLTTISMTLKYDYAYMSVIGGQSNGLEALAVSSGLAGAAAIAGVPGAAFTSPDNTAAPGGGATGITLGAGAAVGAGLSISI